MKRWHSTFSGWKCLDKPDPEKIQKLTTFLNNFGYSLKGTRDEIHPKELQKLLTRIEGTKEEDMLSRLILRSMKRAQYQDVCTGHFGLACKYYCHFTIVSSKNTSGAG